MRAEGGRSKAHKPSASPDSQHQLALPNVLNRVKNIWKEWFTPASKVLPCHYWNQEVERQRKTIRRFPEDHIDECFIICSTAGCAGLAGTGLTLLSAWVRLWFRLVTKPMLTMLTFQLLLNSTEAFSVPQDHSHLFCLNPQVFSLWLFFPLLPSHQTKGTGVAAWVGEGGGIGLTHTPAMLSYVITCHRVSSYIMICYSYVIVCHMLSYVIIHHVSSCYHVLPYVITCYHGLSHVITLSFYCSTSAILAVTVIPFYLHFQSIRYLEMRKGATGTDTWQEVAVALSCRQEGVCLIMVPHIWLVASQTSTVHVGTHQGRSQPGEYRKEAETILPQILYTTGAFSKDHLNLGNFFSSLYLSFHFS